MLNARNLLLVKFDQFTFDEFQQNYVIGRIKLTLFFTLKKKIYIFLRNLSLVSENFVNFVCEGKWKLIDLKA